MSAKHFVNDPIHAVVAALKSLTITNPSLVFDEPNKTIYRHPESITDSKNKISIICGGGSGHEPGWVGYTGCGGLTACVAGSIFASPAAEQVRRCVAHRLPKESTGLLVLAANYTGDVLNFGMGAEKARAMGKDVEMVVMGDDVGVGRKKAGKVGRRGVAGAAFVLKAAGALAEMGASLQDCAHVGRLVVDNVVSIGTSLSRVHVNGMPTSEADEELRRLPYGTSELGMGIHNEPGCEKLETDFPDTIRKMLSQILDLSDQDRAFVDIKSTDRVAMIINNFGGLSNLEIGALLNEVWEQLGKSYGIKPVRVYSGVYNGSLNGLGFTVSLLKLVDTGLGAGRSLLDLIDAPAEIIGWPQQIPVATWDRPFSSLDQTEPEGEKPRPSTLQVNPKQFAKQLTAGVKAAIASEPTVTKYDSIVGDGDCGMGLKRGAEALLSLLEKSPPGNDLLLNFEAVVRVVENTMDGTSGAIYAIFLNALSYQLRQLAEPTKTPITPHIWAKALMGALEGLAQYTPAKVGDRTLVDALDPFVRTMADSGDLKQAAEAAKKGSESTKGMRAKLGRTVYVGGEGWKDIPDPGAYGLSEFLMGLASEW